MAISSQGTQFTFAGAGYTVTSIAVNYGGSSAGDGSSSGGGGGSGSNQRQRVSAAYLDSDPDKAEPFFEIWQPDPLGSGKLSSDGSGTAGTSVQHSVQIEFIGVSAPTYKSVGALTISGPVSLTFSSATCESSSVRLAVGDFVRGNATFTVQ
jgi:hypothetical protein